MRGSISLFVLLMSSAADAQYDKGTYLFEVVGGPVSPINPQVTVRLYVAFPKTTTSSAYGQSNLDIVSDDQTGEFSNLQMGSGLLPPCGFAELGQPSGGGVSGMVFAQIGFVGCVPGTGNPLQVWEATWTTTNFTARSVQLESANTTNFEIFSSGGPFFPDIQLYPDKFEHGSGVIQVVPAPGGAILLAASFGFAVRRRR